MIGKQIIVTRAKGQSQEFIKQLEKYSFQTIEWPLISFEKLALKEAELTYLKNVTSFDWLVFTSANGVHFFMEAIGSLGVTITQWPKVAAVGKKTSDVLLSYHVNVDLKPEEFVAEELLAELKKKVFEGSKVLLARGKRGRPLIREDLLHNGVKVVDLLLYDTVLPKESLQQFHEMNIVDEVLFTFTSSSTVHHFMKVVDHFQINVEQKKWKFACLGPITKKTCLDYGLTVAIQPSSYTVQDFAKAIVHYYLEEENQR
ncbi:putative uroporphyrinogen-III synthase [Bacillus sp. TS-2]|nr:putative uroporphyrinogen-III synthase [Bacillus sp. TS-2]